MVSGAPVPGAAWDAIIVGAGPAGCASAITLAGFGWRVLLVEPRTTPRFKLGESIAPGAVGLVRQFLGQADGVFDQAQAAFQTAGNISIWTGPQPEITDFFYTPEQHGLCVDRLAFDRALRARAEAVGVRLMAGGRFMTCARQADAQLSWQVTLVQDAVQSMHKTRFLLDASGRAAVVGRAMGVTCQAVDALFAYAQWYDSPTEDRDRYTRIEAGPAGWWYSNRLPGVGARRLLVFHTDSDLPAAGMAARKAGFDALLDASAHMGALLQSKDYKSNDIPVRGAPAGSQRLRDFGGPDWLAVGDAAQAYDPLSSQGIWKALDSGSQAGHLVHYQLQSGLSAKQDQPYVQQYVADQEQRWQRYVTQRDFYYDQQPRWRDGVFWQRRIAA